MARLEGAPTPLFLRDDWERVVESMPVFNGEGPVPLEAPEGPVDVPSGDSSKEKEEGEREEGIDFEAESRAPPFGAGPALSTSLRVTMTRMRMSRAAGACLRSRRRTGPG